MFKEYWAYLKKCLNLSVKEAWGSANSWIGNCLLFIFLWYPGRLLAELFLGRGRGKNLIEGYTSLIGTLLAFALLIIFRTFIVAPFQLYRKNRNELRELSEKKKHKLSISFGKDIDGCRVITPISIKEAKC